MSFDTSAAVRETLATRTGQNAIHYSGEWRTWSWVADATDAINRIVQPLALPENASFALISRNRPPHVAVMAAQLAAHRAVSMVYGAQSPAALATDIGKITPAVVFADTQDWTPELIAATKAIGSVGIQLVNADTRPIATVDGLDELRGTSHRLLAKGTALELLSSGTTGLPKRLPLSWDTISSAIYDTRVVYAGAATDAAKKPPPLIMVHPLGNVTGLSYVGPALAYGQPIVLLDKFELAAWVEAVRTFRPVRAALPPAAIRMVLDAKVPKADLASLMVIGVGGSPVDLDLQTRFEDTYDIPILSAFGATEFGGVVASWSLDLHKKFGKAKRGSVGRAAPNVTLRIVDPETSAEVPPDTVGILEARVGRIGPDWIHTTDLARMDEDGFLFLHGRADQAINRGGFKIVPEAVATILRAHPAVADAAVVGIPDERLGEIPVAAVEPRKGVTPPSPDELNAYCREKLIAYQVPVRFLVLDALPRNESMKPALAAVKKMFSEPSPTNR